MRAIWKAAKEFYKVGLIERLPKITRVQVEGYDAVVKAWKEKMPIKPRKEKKPTVASAIAVKAPVDGENVLRAIEESKGHLCIVTNEEAMNAGLLLGQCGREVPFREGGDESPQIIYTFGDTLLCRGRLWDRGLRKGVPCWSYPML